MYSEIRRNPALVHAQLWGPLVAYCLLIFFLSSMEAPFGDLTSTLTSHDKIVHFLEFFALGVLCVRAFSNEKYGLKMIVAVLPSIVVSALYGGLDELHQLFTPGRQADILDFVADAGGAVAGVFAFVAAASLLRRRHA